MVSVIDLFITFILYVTSETPEDSVLVTKLANYSKRWKKHVELSFLWFILPLAGLVIQGAFAKGYSISHVRLTENEPECVVIKSHLFSNINLDMAKDAICEIFRIQKKLLIDEIAKDPINISEVRGQGL